HASPRAARAALPRVPRLAVGSGVDLSSLPGLRSRVGGGRAARHDLLVGACMASRASRVARAWAVYRGAGRAAARGARAHDREPARRSAAAGTDRRAGRGRVRGARRCDATVHAGALESDTMSTSELTVNEPNLWRTKTPGHAGWPRTARPGDPNK